MTQNSESKWREWENSREREREKTKEWTEISFIYAPTIVYLRIACVSVR